MEKTPVEVKVKRTSCRRALSVKLHPNHGRGGGSLGELSWVGPPFDELFFFFFVNFWALDFLGAKKLGPFLKKRPMKIRRVKELNTVDI